MKWILTLLLFTLLSLNAKAQKSTIKPIAKNDESIDDTMLSIHPSFPGGEKAYYKFLARNLKRPNQDDVFGRVFVSFFVEKDGSLSDFKVERSLGKDYDKEALRVLRKSPKWLPARRNGKAIRIKYVVPINFSITE
jgi:protein TonB